MYSRIGEQAPSVLALVDEIDQMAATTHPHRLTAKAQPPYGLKSVGRREHGTVKGNTQKRQSDRNRVTN